MVNRLHKLSRQSSFFLFGPRGTGKSTLIKERYFSGARKSVLYMDLLDPSVEDFYRRAPEDLYNQALASKYKWIIIDEVQKLPKLLDIAHKLIEERGIKFVLSGSSARKLKRGGSNLLAGRAFVFNLYPFTHVELGNDFNLTQALTYGTMPRLLSLKNNEKHEYLNAYSLTYLKEEIQVEQIVRKLDPFRLFLEIAAQMNGQIINFSKIANEVGVDTTTVQNYYSILEDTLLGFFIPSYHKSVRKSQRLSPKFYFFDTGVCRSLRRVTSIPVLSRTYEYGLYFEHFVILEIIRLADYYRKQWKFYYLKTKDGSEIDLIIDSARKTLCVEIKSNKKVSGSDIRHLVNLGKDIPRSKLFCLSRERQKKIINKVSCMEWREGIKELLKH